MFRVQNTGISMNSHVKSLQTGPAILAAIGVAYELDEPEVAERLLEIYRFLIAEPISAA